MPLHGGTRYTMNSGDSAHCGYETGDGFFEERCWSPGHGQRLLMVSWQGILGYKPCPNIMQLSKRTASLRRCLFLCPRYSKTHALSSTNKCHHPWYKESGSAVFPRTPCCCSRNCLTLLEAMPISEAAHLTNRLGLLITSPPRQPSSPDSCSGRGTSVAARLVRCVFCFKMCVSPRSSLM